MMEYSSCASNAAPVSATRPRVTSGSLARGPRTGISFRYVMTVCWTSPASSMRPTLRRCGSTPVSFTETCRFLAKRHVFSALTSKYAASTLTDSPSGDSNT